MSMLKTYLKQPNPLRDGTTPENRLKTPEYRYIPLLADFEKTKRHLTGTIKVTEELAALIQAGNEIKIITFPEKPKSARKAPPDHKPAA